MASDRPLIDEPISHFEPEMLFLSRTDARGVILSGNSIFQLLAGFDWAELIGAPHKIIRHPDMPKAAFHLLWEAIQAGQPFGAYVKNRAKCGRYYWVFAVVVPIEGGYLSVRLKPLSGLLKTVEGLYATLRKGEAEGQSPQQGAEAAHQAIAGLGYRDYADFMTQALGQEIHHRFQTLGRRPDAVITDLEESAQLISNLMTEVKLVTTGLEQIKTTPMNLKVLAARLGQDGNAIKVVAQNYEAIAHDLQTTAADMAQRLAALTQTAQAGRFGHSASVLYAEVITHFAQGEPQMKPETRDQEVRYLDTALAGFQQKANEICATLEEECRGFQRSAVQLHKALTGMSITRVTCQIEAQLVPQDTSGIDALLEQLVDFQEEISTSLDKIHHDCNAITFCTDRIMQNTGGGRHRRLSA